MQNKALLLTIILVAFVIRFPSLVDNTQYVYTEFTRDLDVLQRLHNGEIIYTGPKASLGDFRFGPAYYYLLYPFTFLFGFKVFSISLASAICSTLTVILSFFVVRSWWKNEKLAFLISFILAISNVDIQFAKYASNPNFVPLFSLLFFYCASKIINASYTKLHVFGAGIALGVAIQLHSVPMLSLPLTIGIFILFKKWKLTFIQWLLFVILIVLVNAPYLYYEVVNNFPNFHGLVTISQSSAYYGGFLTHVLEYFRFWFSFILSIHHIFSVILLGGFLWLYVFMGNVIVLYGIYLYEKFNPESVILTNIRIQIHRYFIYVADYIFGSQNIFGAAQENLKINKLTAPLLTLWFLVPSIILLLAPGNVNQLLIWYFTLFLPLAAILLGLAIFSLYQNGLKLTALSLLLSYITWQLAQIVLYHIHYPIW